MPKHIQPRLILIALVGVALLLGACTRSAGTATLPTATTVGGDPLGVGGGDQDATMAAIGTLITGQATQTAVAAAGGTGEAPPPTATLDPLLPTPTGGEVPTPIPTLDPGIPLPTTDPGIIVPPTAIPPTIGVTTCANPYTVQNGDWIYQIARKCGVSARDIIAANPGINPNYIVPGQVINLPLGTGTGSAPVPPATGCTGTRTVVTGDTLFRMAYGCGITVEQLAAANGIAFPYTIFPGQVIRFP